MRCYYRECLPDTNIVVSLGTYEVSIWKQDRSYYKTVVITQVSTPRLMAIFNSVNFEVSPEWKFRTVASNNVTNLCSCILKLKGSKYSITQHASWALQQ
jgi:hypothetical protein